MSDGGNKLGFVGQAARQEENGAEADQGAACENPNDVIRHVTGFHGWRAQQKCGWDEWGEAKESAASSRLLG
jgi:hypothetical protein